MPYYPNLNTGIGTATAIDLDATSLTLSLGGTNTHQVVATVVDAAGTPDPGKTFTLTSVANASTGSTVYSGTITGGGTNAFKGAVFVVTGFLTPANNGTFECTASTTSALTLSNASGAAETALVLTAVGNASLGVTAYTGTITGGGSSSLVGQAYNVTGFLTAANNGVFTCTASTTSILTLNNTSGAAETALVLTAAANANAGTTAYTGTITGGGSNALVGQKFVVAGFDTSANNGVFTCTASTTTILTLSNASGVSDTHAGTATPTGVATPVGVANLEGTSVLVYTAYEPSVATISSTGLVTAVAVGWTNIEVSYPTFNNSLGDIVSSGNPMNGLPIMKIFTEIAVQVTT